MNNKITGFFKTKEVKEKPKEIKDLKLEIYQLNDIINENKIKKENLEKEIENLEEKRKDLEIKASIVQNVLLISKIELDETKNEIEKNSHIYMTKLSQHKYPSLGIGKGYFGRILLQENQK